LAERPLGDGGGVQSIGGSQGVVAASAQVGGLIAGIAGGFESAERGGEQGVAPHASRADRRRHVVDVDQPFEVVDGFGEHAVERPEPRQRAGLTGGVVDVAGRQRPLQRGAEVVDVGAELVEPLELLRAANGDLALLGDLGEVAHVACSALVSVELGEHVQRVGAKRVEQAVAIGAPSGDHGLLHKGRQQFERLRESRAGDLECAVEVKAAGEHAEPSEERALVVGQQLEAPVDGGAQGLLSLGGVDATFHEEFEAVGKP
jgi:hypothetical protein